MGSFAHKRLEFVLTRHDGGVFTPARTDSLTVSGLRASVNIAAAGGPAFNRLDATLFGLTQSTMNDLSTLGQIITTDQRNTIAVYAGDDEKGMGLAFAGTMYEVYTDFDSMPNVAMAVMAQTGLSDMIKPVAPTSYEGGVDVVIMLAGLATTMGRVFENNGISGVFISNPYYPGTAAQQFQTICDDLDIEHFDDGTTLAIWPKGGARGGAIPLVSATTGMIGYPTYTANGIGIRTLFNPNIAFGALVNVQSTLPQACGNWQVYGLWHSLESETPGGTWFSQIKLVKPGYLAIAK